jgi:hypothetical protein
MADDLRATTTTTERNRGSMTSLANLLEPPTFDLVGTVDDLALSTGGGISDAIPRRLNRCFCS